MQEQKLEPVHVQLKGNDAQDLLHRISTINFKSLSLNIPTSGLILSAQGKIECGFMVTKHSAEEATILADDKVFLEILEKFTFAEQYSIETLPLPPMEAKNEITRILALKPKAGNEYWPNSQTNPLEVNLKYAIHDQKGCYPGQEVIEKIIALGSPAKRLCLLKTSDVLKEPLPVTLLDSESKIEVGVITSYSNGNALGIIKRTHTKEGITLITPQQAVFQIEKVSP